MLVLDFLFRNINSNTVNDKTLEAVTDELRAALQGRRFGRSFPLSRRALAIDFRLPESRYLFIAAEPGDPRAFLIRRRLKDLEQAAGNPHAFHLLLRKRLSGANVTSIEKVEGERIVYIRTNGLDETDEPAISALLIQLTGKSSNIFLLDHNENILGALVDKDIDGQRVGERYSQPVRPSSGRDVDRDQIEVEPLVGSISDALDAIYLEREADQLFRSKTETARRGLERQLTKKQTLISRLRADLDSHGDAEKWKLYGDLLLANLSTAKRFGNRVVVSDFFQEDVPAIEIQVDENASLTDAAQKYFKRYSKAQSASNEIQRRIQTVEGEIVSIRQKQAELERAIKERDETYFAQPAAKPKASTSRKEKQKFAGAREFTSSDGFQILVGKRAADNDQLTFRVAGSLDLWLHAADYPGSHVVVRNPNRKDIPQKTLLEAARLAAFYSSGKTQPKAAVHYTQKKFVNKPKGAAPGLVRLASFKTILVEPSIPKELDQKAKL